MIYGSVHIVFAYIIINENVEQKHFPVIKKIFLISSENDEKNSEMEEVFEKLCSKAYEVADKYMENDSSYTFINNEKAKLKMIGIRKVSILLEDEFSFAEDMEELAFDSYYIFDGDALSEFLKGRNVKVLFDDINAHKRLFI